MTIEPFWSTCEALGFLLDKQPILGLAQSLYAQRTEDAADRIDAEFAAKFCRSRGFRKTRYG
ncbi:MAG TPA: hypothetical protein VJ832_13165 [Variovorax sp.]|jgi:hypothetical protein|nr:hypothetical protein [Variovorax sp.]